MKQKTGKTFQLGLFVITGMALFIVAVYFIGSKQSLFGSTFRVSTVFGNVGGLQRGNNVRYSGINVGTVQDLVILTDSTVRVDMVLEKKVRPFIRRNAVASLGTDGLVGSMLVNITPGAGPAPSVEDGDLLESFSRLSPEDLLNTLGGANEDIALIAHNLARTTRRLNEGPGALTMLLQDSLLAEDLRQSIRNLQLTTATLAATSRQLQGTVAGIGEGEGTLGRLLKDTALIAHLDASIGRLDTAFDSRIDPFLLELQQSAEYLSSATETLNAMVRDLEAGRGTAGLLLRDSTTADELRQVLANLNEGTARFSENMVAMRQHFLFRGYFKKMEKEEKREER